MRIKPPIVKKNLSYWVIEEIKRMLISGQLKEGQKLPNQNELAQLLGVSTTSLREALNTLRMIGVIEQKPGLGTVIKSRGAAIFADHLSFPLISDERATVELIEARGIIEVGAVELAAVYATEEQIKDMENLIKEMEKNLKNKDVNGYIDNDLAFHYLIAKASQNRFILHLYATLRGAMEQFMRKGFYVFTWMLNKSLDHHVKIFEALKKRDVEAAVREMRNHINDVKEVMRNYYRGISQEGLQGPAKKGLKDNSK